MLIVQDTSLKKTYILSITNIFKFIKNSNHFRIINKLITSRVLKLARKFVCCDRARNCDLKFPIEKRESWINEIAIPDRANLKTATLPREVAEASSHPC